MVDLAVRNALSKRTVTHLTFPNDIQVAPVDEDAYRHVAPAVLAVAGKLTAPIVKSLPGKAVVPDDHPHTTGGLGLLGTKPSEELMEECDTLLMSAPSFPYTKRLPKPGQARVVQIDIDPCRAAAAHRGAGGGRRQACAA